MDKILLLCDENDDISATLRLMMPDDTKWTECHTVEESIERLKAEEDFEVVIVDRPSTREGISSLISHVTYYNNFMFSIAILVMSDDEHMQKDAYYLGGVVVDVIRKPVLEDVLQKRIENAKELVSNVSFAEFAKMLKALPANIYLKDATGKYIFSSQTWHHLNTGDDPNWTIKGKTDLDIRKDKENAKKALESDLRIIATGQGTSYIIEENDEGQEFLQLIKEPLFYDDGRVRGIIALINNVTEQELLRRRLREQMITDQLTGVYNRGYFQEYARKIESEMTYPCSIIAADCDNLKYINDTFGHLEGDDYIRLCAFLLRTILPNGSDIFRTGGDEFLAILPGVDEDHAKKFISKMEANQDSYLVKGQPLSVSFGSSTMTDGEKDLKKYIRLADEAMYDCKQKKKGNVR